jgi:hypothetical protein
MKSTKKKMLDFFYSALLYGRGTLENEKIFEECVGERQNLGGVQLRKLKCD